MSCALPLPRPELPRAAPNADGLIVCRFPKERKSSSYQSLVQSQRNSQHSGLLRHCSLSFTLWAQRRTEDWTTRPADAAAASRRSSPAAAASAAASASRAWTPGSGPAWPFHPHSLSALLPAPEPLPASSSLIFLSCFSRKSRTSSQAVTRNRATRRLSAALHRVLSEQGSGGVDVWCESNLCAVVMHWQDLLCEAREAVSRLGIARRRIDADVMYWRQGEDEADGGGRQQQQAAGRGRRTRTRRSALWWRDVLLRQERESVAEAGLQSRSASPSLLSAGALPQSLCLALALHSRSSASLPASLLHHHLCLLTAQLLWPASAPSSRFALPSSLMSLPSSRRSQHQQRRQLVHAMAGEGTRGWREVRQAVALIMGRSGHRERQEAQAVVAELGLWFAKLCTLRA